MALNQKDAKSKSCSNEYLTYNNNFAVNLVWFGRSWFGKKPNLVEIRPKIKNIQVQIFNFWVLPNQTIQKCWNNYCSKLIIDLYNFYIWHLIDWAWFQCFYQTKPFQTKPNLQQSYCCKSIINLNNIYSWHLIDFRPNFWVSPNQTLPNQTK